MVISSANHHMLTRFGRRLGVFQIHTIWWHHSHLGPLTVTVTVRVALRNVSTLWTSRKLHNHYIDIIMTMMASQITSLTVVYSTIYSDADQRKHQSSASLAFVWKIHRDRWIPRTKGQLREKCFHLMTSSWMTSLHGSFFHITGPSCWEFTSHRWIPLTKCQ